MRKSKPNFIHLRRFFGRQFPSTNSCAGFMIVVAVLLSGAGSLLSGCAFVTIPLSAHTEPLQETVVSGRGKAKILLVDISGMISSEPERSLSPFEEDISITARVKEELRKAAGDKHLAGVVLRVNSPGGSVTASDILYQEIKSFKSSRQVPVVACMMDIAASGGYYVSLAADTIIAHPTTVTGSIGVIAFKFNAQGLLDKIGIEEESITSGDKKDLWSPFRPSTKEEREILQQMIGEMHGRFIDVIAESRNDLTRERIAQLADGRVYTAAQAADNNLIDGIGYVDNGIEIAKKLAGVSEARVIMYHRPYGYRNNVYSRVLGPDVKTVNLVNIDAGSLARVGGLQFMYLWWP